MLIVFIRFFSTIVVVVLVFVTLASVLFQSRYDSAFKQDHLRASNLVNTLVEQRLCQLKPSRLSPELTEFARQHNYHIRAAKLASFEPSQAETLTKESVLALVDVGLLRDKIEIAYLGACFKDAIVYAPIKQLYLMFNPLYLALLVVAGVGLAALFLAWQITQYLKVIEQSAQSIAKGDLTKAINKKLPQPFDRGASSINRATKTIGRLISEQELLTSSASHEFRTPISRLRLAVEIAERVPDLPTLSRHVRSMETDLDQLEQLVIELMDYSKQCFKTIEMKRSQFSIRDLLIDVCERLKPIQPGVSIEINCDTDCVFWGEKKSIERALTNLVSNGQKYGNAKIWINVADDANQVTVEVCDDGVVIPVEHRQKVLEPFYRVKNDENGKGAIRDAVNENTEGYGLGLAIVNKIVSSHAGQIEIFENNRGGTGVRLLLPR